MHSINRFILVWYNRLRQLHHFRLFKQYIHTFFSQIQTIFSKRLQAHFQNVVCVILLLKLQLLTAYQTELMHIFQNLLPE